MDQGSGRRWLRFEGNYEPKQIKTGSTSTCTSRPVWTARGKIHTEAHGAEALGAKLLRVNDDDEDYFIVMRDPEGNEFRLT